MTRISQPSMFLWPTSEPLGIGDWLGAKPSSADVEAVLRGLFPCAHPVLFSSARAGLTAVLQALGLGRTSKVWIPGFSSHCVIEAVGHFCMPTSEVGADVRAALIYHQWGWKHKSNFPVDTCLVEDAVDTLFKPGTDVFATSAQHVLWSLPKVIGSVGGGVVFCRDAHQARTLSDIRSARPCSALQGVLRLASKSNSQASVYWNGAEALHGALQGPARAQVLRLLSNYGEMFEARRHLLAQIPHAALKVDLGGGERLPSNLPVTLLMGGLESWGVSGRFSAGVRSFNRALAWPEADWEKVAPLPVHKNVVLQDVQRFVTVEEMKGTENE